jgi:hypothetical protein
MFSIARLFKISAAMIAGALILGTAPAPSYADTGSVRFSVGSAGFIFGVGGGSGTLVFKGRTYRLSIGGVRVGTIGISATEVRGRALNMRQASDIAGTYSAAGASIAVIGGGGVARLQNEKGVVLEVSAVKIGLEANLNLGGVTISMQ